MRITLVRHGQTADNHSRVWQGWGGSGLDAAGRQQAAALAARIADDHFDRVVSSDIERVVETAAHQGRAVELDPGWREIDVGEWSGRSIEETMRTDGDLLAEMRAGADVRVGVTGESTHEFHTRVVGALTRLIGQHDQGDRVLVFAHGGVIGSLVADLFGSHWTAGATAPVTNTSITELDVDADGRISLRRFNDGAHLGTLPGFAGARAAAGDRVVTLIRHGQSNGNVADRWEGHACSGLTELGMEQAARLGGYLGPQRALWSSDTPRAVATADQLGTPVIERGLRELWLGSWEGRAATEVETEYADLYTRIYRQREDLPRGGDGERWSDLTARFGAAVDSIVERARGAATLVSHGSAIRALVLRELGRDWASVDRLALMPNTGMARIVVGEHGRKLFDYGITPHLEVRRR